MGFGGSLGQTSGQLHFWAEPEIQELRPLPTPPPLGQSPSDLVRGSSSVEMPAARRFPGLELSFPLLARLRRRLYTVSGGLRAGAGQTERQPCAEGQRAGPGCLTGVQGLPAPAAAFLVASVSGERVWEVCVPAMRATRVRHRCVDGAVLGAATAVLCASPTKTRAREGREGREGTCPGSPWMGWWRPDRDPGCFLLTQIPVFSLVFPPTTHTHPPHAEQPCSWGWGAGRGGPS